MVAASIPIPFALGQALWWVGSGYQEEWIVCPECCGTKAITMVRGDGTAVSVHCVACAVGFEPPTGKVKRIFYQHRPTPFVPRRVEIRGQEILYSTSDPDAQCYSSVPASLLFASKEACQAACDALNAERTKHEEERAIAMLASTRRGLAWSVHYWGRLVKELERHLAQARARLAVCKEKEKSKGKTASG